MNIYEEVVQFMDMGKYRKPSKILYEAFQRLDASRVSEFGEMMVTLAKQYKDLFKDKVYVAFMFQARKRTKDPVLFALDEYIIKKHCLMQGEQLVATFFGAVKDNFNYTSGRVFLTNVRILTSGFKMATSGTGSPGSKSLIGTLRLVKKEAVHQAIRKAIQKSLQADLAQFEILEWANSTPIAGAVKIKKAKKKLTYVVNIPYERKGKSSMESVSVTVLPDKAENVSKILDLVEDVVHRAK